MQSTLHNKRNLIKNPSREIAAYLNIELCKTVEIEKYSNVYNKDTYKS